MRSHYRPLAHIIWGLLRTLDESGGFYLLHHLLPYWRGRDAQHMYLGALFWLIGCLFIFIAWPLIFYYGFRAAKSGWELYLSFRARLRRSKWLSLKPLTSIFRPSQREAAAEPDQLLHRADNSLEKVPSEQEGVRLDGDRNGSEEVAGRDHVGERVRNITLHRPEEDMERIQPVTADLQEEMIERIPTRRDSINDADMIERLGPTRPSRLAPSSVVRRVFSSESDTLLGHSTICSHQSSTAVDEAGSPQNTTLAPSNTRAFPAGVRHDAASIKSIEEGRPDQIQDSEPPEDPLEVEMDKKIHERKQLLISIGILIGLLSWAVQWAFWAGFVYTAGQRYVHMFSACLLQVALLFGSHVSQNQNLTSTI